MASPFADPPYVVEFDKFRRSASGSSTFSSIYFNDSHVKFQAKMRHFVDTEILPFCGRWDEDGSFPCDLRTKAYQAGIYASCFPVEYGGTPPDDCKEADVFHEMIFTDELSRCAVGGMLPALFSMAIGLPPIINAGSPYLKQKVCREVLTGQKVICLAITEPYGGSDVANIQTRAVRINGKTGAPRGEEEEGDDEVDYYVVSGEKKFISAGIDADYFTVAVRTGGTGMWGISLLLLEKGMDGIRITRQKTQGWWVSKTSYITFDKVRVPAKNIIGNVNEGFLTIMLNFNKERFSMCVSSQRFARICLTDAAEYAQQRRTFGQKLVRHQVIRHKLAEMSMRVNTNQAWLELIAFQMARGASVAKMSGTLALCKVNSTKLMEMCAREASQILGGNSYVRGGKGERIERIYREVRVMAIGGGSEEIMNELAMKVSKL